MGWQCAPSPSLNQLGVAMPAWAGMPATSTLLRACPGLFTYCLGSEGLSWSGSHGQAWCSCPQSARHQGVGGAWEAGGGPAGPVLSVCLRRPHCHPQANPAPLPFCAEPRPWPTLLGPLEQRRVEQGTWLWGQARPVTHQPWVLSLGHSNTEPQSPSLCTGRSHLPPRHVPATPAVPHPALRLQTTPFGSCAKLWYL